MNEKHLERDVVKAIRQLGGEVDEFSQRRPGKCRECGSALYAGSQQTLGIPDLRALFPRKHMILWLEIKWGKNKPSPEQNQWLTRECLLGNPATVIYSINDLLWTLGATGVVQLMDALDPHPMTVKYIDLWRYAGVDEGADADALAEEIGL